MRIGLVLAVFLGLAACSKAPGGGASSDVQSVQSESGAQVAADAAPTAPAPPTPGSAADPVKIAIPQMAYIYRYSFRLPGEAIEKAEAAHVALCDRLGPQRCQVLAMQSSAGDGSYSGATLKLRVASGIARQFGGQLEASVAKAGGRAVQRAIEAEDVSKEIVDTDARLRQREMLVARLTEILRARTGKVAELVEAERSVAAAQEEVDQARSWLAVLRARVAMSTFEIGYDAVAASSDASPSQIGDAVHTSASAFVIGLTGIVSLAILLLPWAVLIGIVLLLWWRFRPALRRRPHRGDSAPPA